LTKVVKLAAITAALVAWLFVAFVAPSPFHSAAEREAAAASLAKGDVLWRHPPSRLDMPEGNPGESSLAYAVDHPLSTLKLVASRIGMELAHTRYYFSPVHNLVIAVTLYPLYAFALIGILSGRRNPLVALLVGVCLTHLAIVGATFADYDGRWLFYFLPLIFVLAGSGADRAIERLVGRLQVSRADDEEALPHAGHQHVAGR
jgi:hypothetical protein